MRTPLKYLLIAIIALLALLLAGISIVAATFKPNDYKPTLVRLVKEKTQRTLSIPGDIKLSFFPKIGLDLGRVALSQRDSEATFASVEHAKVSLALIPLLSKQVVVDRVKIDGLRASITRFNNGHTNFDDLLAGTGGNGSSGGSGSSTVQSAGNGTPLTFNIDSVAINNAHILYDDREQGRRVELSNLDFDTGKIADDVHSKMKLYTAIKVNKPELNATLSASTGFMPDIDHKHYVLNDFNAELKGSAVGFSQLDAKIGGAADLKQADNRYALQNLALSANGKRNGQSVDLKFDLPTLTLSDKQLNGNKLSGMATLADGTATIKVQFSAPAFDGSPQAVTLPAFSVDATMPNPGGGSIKLNTSGNAAIQLAKHTLSAVLKGRLDDSAFDATLGMRSFSPPAYTFDIGIDKLDLDHYRAQAAASPPVPVAQPASQAQAADQPLDLSALKNLQAHGKARIGALKFAGIHASNVRVGLNAAGGKLEVDPLAAALYGGSTAGTITVTAATPAHFTLRQMLNEVNVGPLIKDATGKQPIDGKGMVQLDVASSGATVGQITSDLSGNARIELRDGAVHGINIAQTVRSAKARISALRGEEAQQSGTTSASEKTDFSALSGSFRITKGVAHNDDLNVKSPLVRVNGAGDIDLGAQRLDYLARVTVVSTLEGQGGPELQALKGLTVPVRLSGPFSSVGWHVDVTAIANALAKQKLDTEKEALKSKAQEALGEKKQQLQQQLRDKLKGLFGR